MAEHPTLYVLANVALFVPCAQALVPSTRTAKMGNLPACFGEATISCNAPLASKQATTAAAWSVAPAPTAPVVAARDETVKSCNEGRSKVLVAAVCPLALNT